MSAILTSVVPGDEIHTDAHSGVGFSFMNGAAPQSLTEVARWVFSGNTQAHTVSVYSHSGHGTAATFLGSASVTTAGKAAGTISSTALAAAIPLAANSLYAILSAEFAGADVWRGDTHASAVANPAVSSVSSAQIIGGTIYLNSITNNPSFVPTNGTIVAAAPSLGPTDALFSPGNWSGDSAGRAGATYNQTSAPGASAQLKPFTSTVAVTCSLLITNQTAGSQIFYTVNGGKEVIANVPSSGAIDVPLPAGTYTIEFFVEKLAQTGRSTLANSIKFAGVSFNAAVTIGAMPTALPWVRVVADSTEEVVLSDNFTSSYLASPSYQIGKAARALGYRLGMSAHGGAGYLVYGNSDSQILPYNRFVGGVRYAANSRIDKISDGVSLYDSNNHVSATGATGTEPAMMINRLLINDAQFNGTGVSQSDLALSIADSIVRDRAAQPNAWLIYVVPACLWNTSLSVNGPIFINILISAVRNYLAANPGDKKVAYYDRGSIVGNAIASIHRDAAGYALDAQQEGPAFLPSTWDNASNFAPTLTSIKLQTDKIGTNAADSPATSVMQNRVDVPTSSRLSASAFYQFSGARAVTISVLSASMPVVGALVRVTQSISSELRQTSSPGTASYSLNDGVYTVSITAAGYTFVPQNVTVDATHTAFVMTLTTSSTPVDPTAGTITIAATIPPNGSLNYQVVAEDGTTTGPWDSAVHTAQANGSGAVAFTAYIGTFVKYWITGGRQQTLHVTSSLSNPYPIVTP